ncbi:choice-of-anchor C family protein [Actinoallomurus sp. CA-150999]|uniref:choice-of-anchor C family protein n=1 Tax=Actinoallomurus sp. CA-150999 TaxID=3239887 RepID=UPI003D8EFF80
MAVPLTAGPRVARWLTALFAVGALTLCMASIRPAQDRRTPVPLFTNGGFESPMVSANTFMRFGAGSAIETWKVTGGNVDLIGAGFWQAAEGNQSLDLDGDAPGTVEQPVTTRFGGCYTVAFSLAGNPDGGPAIKRGYLRVTQNAIGHPTVQKNFAFDTTGKTRTDLGYVQQRFRFRALAPTVTLTFASTTGGGYGPVIDAVTVTPAHLLDCRFGRP